MSTTIITMVWEGWCGTIRLCGETHGERVFQMADQLVIHNLSTYCLGYVTVGLLGVWYMVLW